MPGGAAKVEVASKEMRCFGALRVQQGIVDGKRVLLDIIHIDYDY